jgi:hypothetical protein
VLTFFSSNVLLGRPIMAPPDVPADRVALLRRSFEAAMRDTALLKEADSMSFEIALQDGDKIAKLIEGIASTPPEIVSHAERVARP